MRIPVPELASCVLILTASCVGCSRSGKRPVNDASVPSHTPVITITPDTSSHRTTIKMKKINGVYEIPATLNGTAMNFILDTGAALVFISDREVKRLHDLGRFSYEDDVTGSGEFQDASGGINEGTLVIIRSLTLGDRTLRNVEASVTHTSDAPLLMGEFALEQFGRVSIDYKAGEISLE